jgi:putative ABC transport system permease protein
MLRISTFGLGARALETPSMHLVRLVLREISYRKGSFGLGLISVAIAVAFLIGELAVLREHDLCTEQILAAKESETGARMATLQDDYRKITKELGFNVLILPREQNLNDLFAEDYASHTMPEEYVDRLANSRLATIQHLLPSLQQKLKWPEFERTILLDGVRGEVPIVNADSKRPILEPVPEGTMVLGWELHRSLGLKVGDSVKLLGRPFTVGKLRPERGTKDDITVWISLKEAQQLLGQPGRINGILALECVCAADSLPKVRTEISSVLPDTQTIEFQSQTLARAEARQRAAAEAREAVSRETENRAKLRQARAEFGSVAVPLACVVSAAWIWFLALSNVRERRGEVAVFRALGVRSWQILSIFLARAVLMGLAGAALGCGVCLLAGLVWSSGARHRASELVTGKPGLLLLIFSGAPLLTIMASWLPTWLAAQRSPAEVLNQA